jgi:hypothetical protein
VPRGSAVQLIEVRTVSNNPWYVSPTATWEANAPATGNSVYWIYITSNANKTAPCGNYYVFYGNYNNTSYSSAYLSFNAELSASVIVNGTVVIAYASGPSGYSPSNPSIKLKPGNNSIVIYTYNNASSSSTTANYAGVWLALTTASAGGGTVIYKTDSTWTWSSVYGCIVGSGTGPSSSKFTLNTTHDFSTTATNGNQGICFIASPGSLGSAGSTSAVNSGTGYLLANNFAPSVSPTGTTPNSTNTSITTNGFTMFISGSTGAGASGGSGGAGGSFSGGTGGVTPTVGQTNGGGGGGGGGSTTNTGALGGDGLVMITFYCAPNQIDSPTPISLGNVATTTNIYNSGSGSSISVPSGAFMLQLYLLGGGGNGGPSNSSGYNGGGGGSGAIGVWFIPVNGLTTYSYTVGIPGTNTSFTINSKAFTANTGGNGGGGTNPIQGTAGVAGTIPTTPSNSVLMLKAIAGLDGSAPLSSSAGGDGAGLYGGDGAVGSTPPTSAGYGSGGGGGKSGVNSGIGSGGGNGLIVARWYFKYANISLTNYTSGPAFTIFPLPPYSNYVAGTYTATPPTGTLSFDVYIIGGQGGGGQGNFRNNPPPTNTISGGGGGGGGTSGYLLVKSIPYGGGTISLTVGAGGLGGTNAPPVYAGGLGGAGGTTSVTYNSTTYSCNGAPATRKGANWVTDGGVYNRGSDGGLGGLGNSTFSPSSGTGITTVSGETGNNGTAGVASPTSYQPPGGALTSFTITYSNGTAAKTFNSGAGNTGESAAGGGTPPNAFAGDAGGVYIIYNGA